MTTADLDRTLTEAATLLSRSGVFDRGDLVEVPADYYEVGEVIARGGMGRISTARDRRSGRIVAIKEVLAEVFSTYPEDERDEVLARFCREAVLTARLEHPSIVPVYEIGRFGEAPFFAMKRVTGEPLDGHINAAAGFEERLALLPKITAVAEAIAYAHDRGVIHRDLKPGNVLVGEFGETLVIDWGLAKEIAGPGEGRRDDSAIESSIDETLEGSVLGTPQYMPPEQARGEPVDRRADVYSVGAILYHLLAGQAPYPVVKKKGVNPIADVLRRVRDEPPESLGALAPETPRDLLSIVEKAMARDPGDRYGNAAELAADLESFQRGQLVAVHDYSAAERIRRWLRRHRAAVTTAAVLLAALLAAGVWFVIENRQARMRAESAIDRWVSMFEQRGREELHHGDIATAALILAETYQQMPDDPGVATMLGDATRAIAPLRRVLRTSRSPLTDIVLIDEKRLATTGEDRRLVTVDTESGEQIRSVEIGATWFTTRTGDKIVALGDHVIEVTSSDGLPLLELHPSEPAMAVAVDWQGRAVAVGSRHGLVEIFDLETGERIVQKRFNHESMPSTETPVFAIAFHRGSDAVAISAMTSVTVWEDHRLGERRWVKHPTSPFPSIDFSTAHDRLVAGTIDGRALLLDGKTGEPLAILDGHTGKTVAHYDPTGERIVSWGGLTTRIWHGKTGSLISAMPGWTTETTAIAIDDRGELMALGGANGNLRLVDLEDGRLRSRLVGHAGPVRSVSISPTGETLASTAADGAVKLWDSRADLRAVAFPVQAAPWVEVAGDRMLTWGIDSMIKLWDPSRRQLIATLSGSRGLAGLSPEGRLVVTRGGLYSAATGEQLSAFELDPAVLLTVTDDGTIISMSGTDILKVHDRDGTVRREVKIPGARLITGSLTPDGRHALLPGLGVLHVVDLVTGELSELVHERAARAYVVSYGLSGDGERVAVSSSAGTSLWKLAGSELIDRSDIGSPSLAYHPDRDLIALGASDRILLWAPGSEMETVGAPGQRIGAAIRFSADGQWMVTTGDPVRVWELETREVLINRPGGRVSTSLVSEDGRSLITISNTEVGFWEIAAERRDPEVVRRLVGETVPRDFTNGRGVVSRPVGAAR